MRRFGVAAIMLLVMAVHGADAVAQPRHPEPAPAVNPVRGPALGQVRGQAGVAAAGVLLPAPVSSEHTLELPGRTLHFTATAGSVPLRGDRGQVLAEISVIAYRLDSADPRTRPVTFAVNGGPGFSSAWLQLGGLGPWRLPMEGAARAPSAPPAVTPNAETWLDFTDLVFIDPAGTGYSRIDATAKEVRQRFWSVGGDISSLAQAIRLWLDQNGRMPSPKYIVGESYGGFRGPRLVRALAETQGVGVAGLVLVSPSLDLDAGSRAFNPLSWAARLPTEVAIARTAHGPVTRTALADAEAYAGGDYVVDLVRGLGNPAAVARVSQHVAALTGLDPALVRQHAGRIDAATFLREIDRAEARVASRYDGTVTMPDPFGSASFARFPDPVTDALAAPLSSAMVALYANRLHWRPDAPYRLFNAEANRSWNYGKGGGPQAMFALRTALALDPRFHVVVAAGLFDLVVPYFRTQMLLDTIPGPAGGDRVRFVVLPGGHMVYVRDDGRMALRDAAGQMIGGQ
ncbi:MAG TPA: peptidase S10 [Acetobacteraceae bacterium]|nr:peptidase S10 [Acetobacteraceae bacterium]